MLRKFQYLAYRQLICHACGWQYLGRHRHVVLPSCAVAKIRQVFPSESEDHAGHNIHQPHHNIFTYIIVLHVCSYICISNYVNVYNVRIKGLLECLYALANVDGVSAMLVCPLRLNTFLLLLALTLLCILLKH